MRRIVVVGLGTAGSAVAAACARRGLAVVGIDAAPLEQAGARWVNGVPGWAFAQIGLEAPAPPELRSASVPYHIRAGWSAAGVRLSSVLEVDMPLLAERLRQAAVANGASLRGEVRVTRVGPRGVETTSGSIEGDVVVDASGYVGARLLDQGRLEREDLCAAAQQVRRVRNRAEAEAFFRRRGAAPGEVLCFTGVAGGYSVLNVRLDGDEVSLLTGSIPALGNPGGQAMLDRFVAEQPWIGDRVSGGARAIPLRRAWEVVGGANVALVGDAACQVFAAHGSGIGQELLASGMLADVLAAGGSPWDYNVAWQRRYGGLLASSDRFRRFSQTLDPDRIAQLIQGEVLAAPMIVDTLEQRPVRPPIRALLRAGRGLLRLPGTARALAPVLASMRLVERHYRSYPGEPADLPGWVRRLERLDPRGGPVIRCAPCAPSAAAP